MRDMKSKKIVISGRTTKIKPRSELEYENYLKERGFSVVLERARVLLSQTGETLLKPQRLGLYRDYKRWLSRFQVAREMNCATLPEIKVERCYRCGWVMIYDHINTTKSHNSCGNPLCFHGRLSGNQDTFAAKIGSKLGVDVRLCGTKTKPLSYFCSPQMRVEMMMFPQNKVDESKFYWRVIEQIGLGQYIIRLSVRLCDTGKVYYWKFFTGVFLCGGRFIYPFHYK